VTAEAIAQKLRQAEMFEAVAARLRAEAALLQEFAV
jgi:hypothetical protein